MAPIAEAEGGVETKRMPGYARYTPEGGPVLAQGWRFERLTPPSRLYGANGVCAGPDGRIYVAQVSGSAISAVDIDTGAVDTISPRGGPIVGPDDVVFDDDGNLYVTEITEGRVSVRPPNGETRILRGDIAHANPITFHQGRLFAGELRADGRIVELDRHGGEPRVLVASAMMPNAFQVGPDGMLYYPAMAANEIWRVRLDGGAPERVVGDLGMPTSVKFDSAGRIVSTQMMTGQVLRIDPRNGRREALADIGVGLDNLAFVGDRLFVTNVDGSIHEVQGGGALRSLVPAGFNWPLDVAMGDDDVLYVADGLAVFALEPGGAPQAVGGFFTPGCPGYARGLAAPRPGELIVTTADGKVARWRPAARESEVLAEGFDELYGVAAAPGGAVVFAEAGRGRVLSVKAGEVEVLASGLDRPTGVAVDDHGACFVTETAAGRVVQLSGGRTETVLDGLKQPQGILLRDGRLYVVDALAKELVEHDLATRASCTIAANLPVGAPLGATAKSLGALGPRVGPQAPFAGLTAGADGSLYLAGDAEGAILALRLA